MYWPIGTPRIYAAPGSSEDSETSGSATPPAADTSNRPQLNVVVSHDGLPTPDSSDHLATGAEPSQPQLLSPDNDSGQGHSNAAAHNTNLASPLTPVTPLTPAIKPVEHDDSDDTAAAAHEGVKPFWATSSGPAALPRREPVLALRVARSGQIFTTITSTSITVWQTKPTVILAVVVRSSASLRSYGFNVDLLLRPDSAIIVVHTSLGYLITYSLATDADARVYKPHFPNHLHVQRRKQHHIGGPGYAAPEDIYWGPGEGPGVRDVSVRFRMVIKVDAGIESALAQDDELVVATHKPAAVQCIRWTPDSSGSQTSTEILSRMPWLGKKVTIRDMTHDRPMNLSTWITSDGRAYAVQRNVSDASNAASSSKSTTAATPAEPKKLFRGYCFHVPQGDQHRAVRAVINARFSLIAVGCVDGNIQVYSARDYSGNIPASHRHNLPVSPSTSGALTTLAYSPDGYCLFAGFEKGWATWSVYGKALSHSFGADSSVLSNAAEGWIAGVRDAAWVGGACEILLVAREHDAIWLLEMARSAVTGCYSSANLFRTVLQSTSSVMIYRGYDLPDLSSISAEPFLWHTARIPSTYLLNQWPIRCTVTSADGRYVAIAGRRGLAHYSVSSGRWKTYASEAAENEFQVRGGMAWYRNILVAAVEAAGSEATGGSRSYELRLLSRDAPLDSTQVLHAQAMPAPVVLITPSGEDSLLVYTYDNLLYHFVFAPVSTSSAVRLIQVGQIAFHGIVRSPARVRGLSWVLPESQLVDGDPSQDVALASVLFLVDGKLVLLRPSLTAEGQLKYDMRVVSHSVEYHACMRDQPFMAGLSEGASVGQEVGSAQTIQDSLWIFDGSELKAWTDMEAVLSAVSGEASRELPPTVSIPVDFYPLSILMGKGVVLGVEPDLVQRRDITFSYFRFTIRTHLFLPDILRFYLARNQRPQALRLAQHYAHLEYFPHALEVLLHHVLDEEVDASPAPAPEDAVLPRVLSLLSSFRSYLDVVVRCTRKTEARSWRTLFAYLPPPQELFEESLQRGSLKTAGGYLLVLHTFDNDLLMQPEQQQQRQEQAAQSDGNGGSDGSGVRQGSNASEQSVRLLTRAIMEEDWELCKELARFLAAMDESGDTLRAALETARARAARLEGGAVENSTSESTVAGDTAASASSRLEVPVRTRRVNGSGSGGGAVESGSRSCWLKKGKEGSAVSVRNEETVGEI